MAIANQIAQFGMNAGRDIQGTVRNAITRNENRDRYDEQQARLDRANTVAQDKQALEREQAYAANGYRIMSELPPEQRPMAWQQWVQTGAQQGIDMKGIPLDYDDSHLQRLAFQGSGVDRSAMPSSLTSFNAMTQGMTPEDVTKARRIELGLDARAVGAAPKNVEIGGVNHVFDPVSKTYIPAVVGGEQITPETVAESESTIKQAGAVGTAQGKGQEERAQDQIGRGLEISKGIPSITRAIALLDSVKTGGVDRASLKAKEIFGVESADEGELSNLLGKAVLSQLRETFGAQFTVEEGKRLESIEANLGKSPAANRRALANALTMAKVAANRAKRLAKSRNDTETVDAIDQYMSLDLGASGPKEITTKEQYDALPSGTVYLEDGQEYRKP